jgi:hypothetical protein
MTPERWLLPDMRHIGNTVLVVSYAGKLRKGFTAIP